MGFSIYKNTDRNTALHIGGIGTGTIGIDAGGHLCNFEIFNKPDKGNKLPYSFFAIHWESENCVGTKVLEAHSPAEYNVSTGYHPNDVRGLPHMQGSSMTVKYPFCHIEFEDAIPLDISLTAYNPLIPLNVKESAIPGMVMSYNIKNTSDKPMEILLCGSLPNFFGFTGFDVFGNYNVCDAVKNISYEDGNIQGVFMTGDEGAVEPSAVAQGALMTDDANAIVCNAWYKGSWYDGITAFWKSLCNGKIPTGYTGNEGSTSRVGPAAPTVCSVGISKTLMPGESYDFRFIISWYVPNRVRGWNASDMPGQTIKNHYAVTFKNAWEAGTYLCKNRERLEKITRDFVDAMYSSTLPEYVIDAAALSISVLRSNTCFMVENGAFFGWEGCHVKSGSCAGTCTHVYNYAHTIAFLFPELEMSARKNELFLEMDNNGKIPFRTMQAFGMKPFDMHPAADGQLGVIIRTWREYMLSGDIEFLSAAYPKIKKAMEYASKTWDQDEDGLLEACQHNTYDIEFYGVNPLTEVMYICAFKAMEKMAEALKMPEDAKIYGERAAEISVKFDKVCFNGSWYYQPGDANKHFYQFGEGCLSDQLFGQTLAYITGIGELLPKEHIISAAKAIYKYNYLHNAKGFTCMQRSYIEQDEEGLLMCSWPNENEPTFPFVYANEVWTGVEYQVATMLIYLGFIEEALQIVKSARLRYDGNRRNPFAEMECGFHYARSMAAWGLITALSGTAFSPDGKIEFTPRINKEDFSSFYCDGKTWGILTQKIENGNTIQSIKVIGTR